MNLNYEENPINLEEIKNIDEKQFRQQMINWIESRDINDLQLQMKKYLIENFNKTALGRELSTKNLNHKVPLNPFYIILNVLIAEYLYKENLHFSLSILSTEIPYKNILPNFDESKHYRFDVEQLNEILQTLGLGGNNKNVAQLNQSIIKSYKKQSSSSLLHILFNQLIRNANEKLENVPPAVAVAVAEPKEPKENIKLNTSIELLHKNIQNLCKGLDQLEQVTHDEHRLNSADLLSMKKEKINSLINRLEKCTDHFERVLPRLNGRPAAEYDVERMHECGHHHNSQDKMEYEEWLRVFVDSKMGQKYIKKLERHTNRIIEREKDVFRKHFDEKLVKEKLKMEIDYKDKIAQFLLSKVENAINVEKRDALQQSNVKRLNTTIRDGDDSRTQTDKYKEFMELNVLQNRKIERLEDENIEKIIQNARLSIEKLERESEYLFNSFKDYLRKGKIPLNFEKYDNIEDMLSNLKIDKPITEPIPPLDLNEIEKSIPTTEQITGSNEPIPEIDNQLLQPIDLSKFQNPFDNFQLIGQSK